MRPRARRHRRRSLAPLAAAAALLAGVSLAVANPAHVSQVAVPPTTLTAPPTAPSPGTADIPDAVPATAPACRFPKAMLTAGSRAVGRPNHGRLTRGVQFPAQTPYAFTWNFPGSWSPNADTRRWGTEKLVKTIECVLYRFGAEHPGAPRIGVADLSRPRGGHFGKEWGGDGHASHQNGLDVDVLYPRSDLCECAAETADDVDAALAQELVTAFVRAGARYVFVSPVLYRRGLVRGPKKVVMPLWNHDDHLHVRIRP